MRRCSLVTLVYYPAQHVLALPFPQLAAVRTASTQI